MRYLFSIPFSQLKQGHLGTGKSPGLDNQCKLVLVSLVLATWVSAGHKSLDHWLRGNRICPLLARRCGFCKYDLKGKLSGFSQIKAQLLRRSCDCMNAVLQIQILRVPKPCKWMILGANLHVTSPSDSQLKTALICISSMYNEWHNQSVSHAQHQCL